MCIRDRHSDVIKASLYSTMNFPILSKFSPMFCAVTRKIPIRSVLLHHDNARLHTDTAMQAKLEEVLWTDLNNLPNSPALLPCDFILSESLRLTGGKIFP